MRKLLFISFVLLFSFCSKKEKHKYPRITLSERDNLINVNTKTMLHITTDEEATFFLANFDSDTLIEWNPEGHGQDYKPFKKDNIFAKNHLKIIIDTSYTIAARGFEYKNVYIEKYGITDFGKLSELMGNFVVCYPLLIYNNGDRPICSERCLKFIQEAKDTDGKWKPIEFFADMPTCIPMLYFSEFLPKKYTCMSIIKYHGDFKTKLRVKMRLGEFTYYSNEIDGNINRTQFDKNTARERLRSYTQFGGRYPISDERLSYAFLKNVP